MVWSSLSEEDTVSYFTYTDVLSSNIYLSKGAIICNTNNCTNIKHKIDISAFYNHIVTAPLEASTHLCKHKRREKPGLAGTHMGEFYVEACEVTKSRALAGKPRQGPIFNIRSIQMLKTK